MVQVIDGAVRAYNVKYSVLNNSLCAHNVCYVILFSFLTFLFCYIIIKADH